MPGKPMTHWWFCAYPQSLWIRLWKDSEQALSKARGIGTPPGLVKISSRIFYHYIQ
jgi:hypothetical protein